MYRSGMVVVLALFVVALAATAGGQTVTDYGKQTNPLSGPSPAYEIRYLSVTGAGTAGDPYVMYLEDRNNSSAFTRVVSTGDHTQFPATGTVLSGYDGNCHPTVYEMSPGNWIMYTNGCPSTSYYNLSTDGGVTWSGGGNLGLNTDNGAGIAAVYDDPVGGKVHFWYQDGGGNLLYCNSGSATGDARYYSPDPTTEKVAFAKTEAGVSNGFTPSGGVVKLPSGDYGFFLLAQDDSGVQLATSPTLDAGAGSWTFLFDHSSPLIPKTDASLSPPRLSLKECSVTDLGGGVYGIHYDGEFDDGSVGDEDYGFATVDMTPPVHNVTQDTYYWTIQAGINAANAGDVIEVAAGTYAERLTINKDIDLRGAQYGVDPTPAGARVDPNAESIITELGLGTPNPDVLIEVTSAATGASVDGFTLNGDPTNSTADTSTLRIWADDFTVSNNIIDGRYCVLFKGGDGITVSQNDMTGNKSGVTIQPGVSTDATIAGNVIALGSLPAGDESGVYMTSVTDISVTGNTVSGFTSRGVGGSNNTQVSIAGNTIDSNRDGVSMWGSTTFLTIDGNDITNSTRYGINVKGQDIDITGNVFAGSDIGVGIDKHTLTTERVTLTDNDLSGCLTQGLEVTTAVLETVDASANYWGSTDPAAVRAEANTGAGVDYTPWLGGGTAGSPGFSGDYSELWVDDDSEQSGSAGRINEGIDVVSGSTVHVEAGTYNENVVIDKPVDLLGEDGAVIDGTGLTDSGVFIDSGDVTLDNFEIRNFALSGHSSGVLLWVD
ncbi:MAG: hypothetical protein GF400_04925, partial [Candidatus Eisenbacteria bacterium]|nr:hypothetical protein [Candidatus Eisenbacteria bacterium]